MGFRDRPQDGFRDCPQDGFRLLVFDWDGTLMDSIGTLVACTQAAVRDLGIELPDGRIRAAIGLGMRESIEVLAPGCDEALFGRIMEAYRRHWFGTYRDLPLLFHGVDGMLRGLADAGYLLGVATGKSRRGLDHVLAQTGLGGLFHSTRTVDEAPSKPHPGMLLGLLDELGVKPAEALMIGDTTFDLEMAANAGTAALAVCGGSHSREELERTRPLACLESVLALPAWLAAGSAGSAKVLSPSPSTP